MATSSRVGSLGEDDFRRSIYVQVRRKTPLTVLDTFDAPVMVPNCENRNSTTVAPQSLLLMNDTFVLDTARALALRLRKELPGDARGADRHAHGGSSSARAGRKRCPPQPRLTSTEQTEAARAYHQGTERAKDAPPPDPALDALASLCQILLQFEPLPLHRMNPLASILPPPLPAAERLRPRLARAGFAARAATACSPRR